MPDKRIVQAGHLLSMLFVTLLLAGARQYLAANPFIAALLLALFAAPYYAAAHITGYRQFLYPAVLLLVLAYHLFWHGAGLAPAFQPVAALVPVAVLSTFAAWKLPPRPERAAPSLHGCNAVLIAAMSLWILFRVTWFYQDAPLAAALALAGFGLYSWFRFRASEKPSQALAMVALGSSAALFLLYRYPAIGLLAAAAVLLRVAGALFFRRLMPSFQGAAAVLMGAYLFSSSVNSAPAVQLWMGYVALGAAWIFLALLFDRPGEPALMGRGRARLPRLLPLFAGGALLTLAPVSLFYPWEPVSAAMAYLAMLPLIFLTAARDLGSRAVGLVETTVARLFGAIGRVAPLAALVYVAAAGFPAEYGAALGALSIAFISLLWAWLEQPKLLQRRNWFAYQAGLFLVLAYFLAERRLALAGMAGALSSSGALAVLALSAIGWLIRKRISIASRLSLYEAASFAAITGALIFPTRFAIEWPTAAALGLSVIVASAFAFSVLREAVALFPVPVVLGFWLYLAEWQLGVRGEWLGLPYLILGMAWAALGYRLLRRASRWSPLLYFMWFLSVAVSLLLFAPFHAVGAWGAPLWPLAFVLVARAAASRRDLAFAWGLEAIGAALAVTAAARLLGTGFYPPAAFALLVYAALYAWIGQRGRLWPYTYPAAFCLVAAFHLALLAAGWARLSLPDFLPLAAGLYLLALFLRQRERHRAAFALELAASAGAVTGAAILLASRSAGLAGIGSLAGLEYLVLYGLLARYGREPIYLAGTGLAGAFGLYEFLAAFSPVAPDVRLAFLIPVAWVLALLGNRRSADRELRGAWALYAAAMATAAAASFFVLWPMASPAVARVTLAGSLAVWLALLLWTHREIFIYCATLVLAMLAYHFVQHSTDLFGRHLVSFFLWGTALLGIVFVAAVARNALRFRRPTLFLARMPWRYRYLYVLPVGLLGLATFGAWGVDTSSNPIFCGACHQMRAYFSNWKASPHAQSDIGCPTCHYEPGLRGYAKAKMQGLSELVIAMTGTESPKPSAQVHDGNCLRAGCHSLQQLAGSRYPRRVFYFNHATHLSGAFVAAGFAGASANPWRGPELRCTSCHTDVSPESHFAVDTNACFTCHFQAASEPQPAIAGVGCVGCHGLPAGERGPSGFEHAAAGVTARDEACDACHAGLSHGSQQVEERRCRHCHLERSETLLRAGMAAVHRKHVQGQGIACDWCHDTIRHRKEPEKVAVMRSVGGAK